MWKPLWVLAVMASTFFVQTLAGSSASSYSSSSSHSSSSVSSSSSSNTSYTHSQGKCVAPPHSKKCPKPNEILDPCLNPCPPRYCGVNIAAISCAVLDKCEPGCRCADGYLRNDKGICIPEDKCPKCPKPNEEYDVCPALCPPRECGVNKALILCVVPPKPGDLECEPGCRCSDGFLRNTTGICIPEDQCPKCTKPNEVYDVCPAPCPPRKCDVDDRVIRCAAPPKPGDPECEPGCRCADGYVRNNDDVCVTRDQCPPKCGDQEELVQCPPAVCRPKVCSDVGKPIPCPDLSSEGCPEKPACICKDGYAKNKDGDCVPWNQCPSCGGDINAVSGCGINCNRHCSDRNKPSGACAAVCLYNACDCKEGLYFDDNIEKCVRPENCSLTCKKNEEYSDCINICQPQNCSQLGFPIACPASDNHCVAGCKCKDGYLRADNGTCIPMAECPSCGGDPHAVSGCGVNCNKHCSDLHGSPKPCLKICHVNACDCKNGYYHDDHTKKCVLPKQCTPECKKKHEVYSNCVNGGGEPRKCSDLGFPERLQDIDESQCVGGCVCEEGYVYDHDGNCIPKNNCPSCGGDPNAVSGCGVNCGRHCSNYNKGPVPCPRICFPNSCDCKKEFVFDDNIKKCVLPKHCTPICKENEVYSECINGGCRAKNCSQLGKPIPCVKIDPAYCIKGCLCKNGYLRAKNGTCVPEDKCDNCNQPHEVWDPCPPNCPPQTCESIGKKYFCPLQGQNCTGACRCEKGYYRNKIGQCISDKDCLKCQGPHEYFSCGGACDNVCATLHEQNQTNCPIVNIVCNPMCYCEKDFARDNNNICVPIDKCPKPHCRENEKYEKCPATLCSPQNCSQLGFPIPCPITSDPSHCPGPPGCICKDGYVRNGAGICIPIESCPSCGGDPNAVSGCGINCGRLCSNYNSTEPIVCPLICKLNGCDCRKGFVFDDNIKKCVLPKHCTPVCKDNEVYSGCINGGCRAKNCSQLGKPIPCVKIDPAYCIKGCLCKNGYFRAKNGTCVPEDKCDNCNQPHEVWDPCPPNCPPQTCESIGKKYFCPLQGQNCTGACRCEKGYSRNKIGQCISEKDCLKCQGPHEYFSCGGACDNVCATLHEQNQTNCPIVNIVCNPMCYCEKNFARDNNNICVPIDKCPKPHCRENEKYEKCPATLCTPQNCSQLGFPIPCPVTSDPSHCPGPPGCICKDGYVRNGAGICIPIESCPSCGGDPNAVSGCGINCGRLCSNYNNTKPIACPQICKVNGCDCRKGFVFDQNTNKCVRPKDCTPICKQYEVYDTCANGGCSKRNCSQIGEPDKCIRPIKCLEGCVCTEGYLRNSKGVCVPEDECPQKCHGANEYYDSCPPSCPPQTCESIGKKYHCPLIKTDIKDCKGACRCKEGFYRNKIGECISEKDCLKCQGQHEYFSCGGACDNVCATLHEQNQTNCPIVNIVCNPMCYCEKDFARDNNNICVPIDKCPTPTCKKNEVYDACANGGCSKRNCSQIDDPEICVKPKKCLGGCVCQKGYLRNSKGVCVPENECPRKCDRANEYYDTCPPICPPQTCESIGKAYSCPAMLEGAHCNGSCRCKKGFYRNKIGDCISEKDCLKCPGSHEFFSCGGACDNVCATLDKQNQTNCPIINIKCNEMCYCEKDFARDDKDICIPIKKCPARPVCKEHEVYDSCANGGCDKRNCTQKDQPSLCIDPIKCMGGCVCEKGYLRAANGKCIPEDQCPPLCKMPHEMYDPCPNNCPIPKCESIDATLTCPLLPDDGVHECKGACLCELGYYRNKIGECHTESDCRQCEGPNEYFSCGGACDNVCSTLSKQNQTNCPIINIKCNPMCYCDKDYARDDNGICIPINQCGVSCNKDPNAVPGCGTHCGRRCSDYNSGPVVCPAICLLNGCDCKQNYVFDDNIGKCVLPKDCTPVCKPNEVYDFCANGGCRHRDCSDLGGPILCIDPIKCEGGCICQKGYLRAEDGTCVPEEQCPNQCIRPHEVYNPCPSDCPPQTCESLERAYVCPIRDCVCNCPAGECDCNCCRGDCVCEDGYYRNLAGECISEQDCRKCTEEHEFYSCRAPCDNVCATLNIQNQTSCPLDSIECKCFCEEGYARDKHGDCIFIDDCPEPRCGPNERYEEDPASLCEPFYCTELGFPIDCPRNDTSYKGKPVHCICRDGYVRNSVGICIPKTKCDSCGGDKNAVSGCGNMCGKSCSDYQDDNVVCLTMCYPNGCDCKEGYVYNGNSKECVHPKDCSPANNTEALARLNEGSIALTGEFLYQLLKSNPGTNVVASATSALIPLADLAYFATGTNLNQLLGILNLKSKDEIKSVIPSFLADYQNQSEIIFEIENKYFVNINYPLSSEFIRTSLEIFRLNGENIDFSDNNAAADKINDWVAASTDDKITDLVSPDMFSADTRLVLCNAIYFQGNWQHQFNPNKTETKDFYLDDTNTVQVPIMYQEATFKYYEDNALQVQALEMPYKNSNFSFLVILPEKKGTEAVITVADKLRDATTFTGILDKMTDQKVQVYLPRIKMSTSIDVAKILKEAGVTEMFNPNSDGFSGILENPEPIYVSDAVQKAFISVDETGTEAAAATAFGITALSLPLNPPPVYVFNANHPYIFFIKLHKTLIFCGAFLF